MSKELYVPEHVLRERQANNQRALRLSFARSLHDGLVRREQQLLRELESPKRKAGARRRKRKAQKQARRQNR